MPACPAGTWLPWLPLTSWSHWGKGSTITYMLHTCHYIASPLDPSLSICSLLCLGTSHCQVGMDPMGPIIPVALRTSLTMPDMQKCSQFLVFLVDPKAWWPDLWSMLNNFKDNQNFGIEYSFILLYIFWPTYFTIIGTICCLYIIWLLYLLGNS